MSLLKKKAAPEGEAAAPEAAGESYAQRRARIKAEKKAGTYTEPKKRLSRAEIKRIKKERKKLRKELKKNGIKKRSEFEMFAREVGLGLPEDSFDGMLAAFLALLSRLWAIFTAYFTLTGIILGAIALLTAIFLFAYITEMRGQFTINLTADMLREGFQLSEDGDFSDEKTRLFAEKIENCNATSIYEMNRNVQAGEGSHNGPGYLAYTFYLKNAGTMTTNYGYTMNLLSDSLGTSAAAWVMFFEEDKQVIYAQEIEENRPENLYGYPDPPFIESALLPDSQYDMRDGTYRIITTPFLDEHTVMQGYVEDFEPDEVRKYTIVVWLEGDDPDCNNKILGGHVGFNIQFERLGDDETGYFKGLFRTEYDLSYAGENVPEYDVSDHPREDGEARLPEDGDKW